MNKPNHILVIRLSALGDVAMTVPVLLAFTKTYPDVQLTVLSKPFFKPLFDGLPNVNFLPADVKGKHKGFWGLLKLAKEAKNQHITQVADLHNVIRSKIIGTLLLFQGITLSKINKGRKEKKAVTRLQNKQLKPLKSTHQRYIDVFKKLGYPFELTPQDVLSRKPLPLKLTHAFEPQKKLIGIAPFAAHKSKMYPLHLMKQVVKKLTDTQHYHLLFFGGGENEIKILSQWEKEFKDVRNIAGKLTFKEELDLISNLDLMLSMDSGNGHLSAMYGVPVVTLWGVTHPYLGFTPFNQPEENRLLPDLKKYPLLPTSVYGNKFPEGYENVMETISPTTVVEKVLSLLA